MCWPFGAPFLGRPATVHHRHPLPVALSEDTDMKPTDMHTGLTAERVREIFSYDPEEGVLRWRKTRKHALVGMAAGCKKRDGYIRVRVGTRAHSAHRLAWLHFHGEWPADQIDHINGVKDDNRAVNLRDVSNQANSQNRREARRMSTPSPFSTGLLGTYFDRKRQLFVAKIKDPTGKYKNLGGYSTAEKAHAVYLEAKRRLHEGNTL